MTDPGYRQAGVPGAHGRVWLTHKEVKRRARTLRERTHRYSCPSRNNSPLYKGASCSRFLVSFWPVLRSGRGREGLGHRPSPSGYPPSDAHNPPITDRKVHGLASPWAALVSHAGRWHIPTDPGCRRDMTPDAPRCRIQGSCA